MGMCVCLRAPSRFVRACVRARVCALVLEESSAAILIPVPGIAIAESLAGIRQRLKRPQRMWPPPMRPSPMARIYGSRFARFVKLRRGRILKRALRAG